MDHADRVRLFEQVKNVCPALLNGPFLALARRALIVMSFEDLLQECFLRVWVKLPSYDPKRSRPSTFAALVVRQLLGDVLKRSSRAKRRAVVRRIGKACPELARDPWQGIDQAIDGAEQLRAIAAAVAELPDREREIIAARFSTEPRTYEEVGDEMGLSKERVRQILMRALGQIQRRVA